MKAAFVERKILETAPAKWLQGLLVRRMRHRLNRASQVQPVDGHRRIYIDVSVITRDDAGTGIQRVVRALATALLQATPEGWTVVPVGATRKRPYHQVTWPSRTQPGPALAGRQGDVFLGLDFSLDDVSRYREQLALFKQRGGSAWFVMYDLLPIEKPDWFSDKLVVRFRQWLEATAGLADGFFCISAPVEDALRKLLQQQFLLQDLPKTAVIPLGWDLESARKGGGYPVGLDEAFARMRREPSVLVVGTIEPRKGHAVLLDAFDLLWEQGFACNLVIVGKEGWKSDRTLNRLRHHPRLGERLFWFSDASDDALELLYERSHGVIVASLAEGFGLPLLEALGHRKPVLARDLPVFRWQARELAQYFPAAASPSELAASIRNWVQSAPKMVAPQDDPLPRWTDSMAAIVQHLTLKVAA